MTDRTCAADDCDRPAHCRQLCTKHYQRARLAGQLPIIQKHRPHQARPDHCTIDDCRRPVQAQGLCDPHYRRWRTNGDPRYLRRVARAEKYDARDGHKLCTKCQTRQSVDQFYRNCAARDGYLTQCKTCIDQRCRDDRAARPEIYRKKSQDRYAADPDKARRKTQAYRAKQDPETKREKQRLYDQKRRDRRRLYDQTRRQARAEQCKAWRTPERSRAFVARRRALKLAAPQGCPQLRAEYVQIIMRDPCAYCGAPAEAEDHIQPLTKGGADAWDNLAPACTSCNCRKHSRTLLEFLLLEQRLGVVS